MRLLLLGCTGFVGKELVSALLEEGHNISVVSRKSINKLHLKTNLSDLNFLKTDLSKEQNWKDENLINVLRDSDGIINLIGEPIADKKWTK